MSDKGLKNIYNLKSEVQKWESQLEDLSRLDFDVPNATEFYGLMYDLCRLHKALSEYTLEYNEESMESIQRDISRVTSIYENKLELLSKEVQGSDDQNRLEYMGKMLKLLAGFSTKLSGIEQRVLAGEQPSDLYTSQVVPRPAREDVFSLSSISDYVLKLDMYLEVKSQQVKSRSLTIEDTKSMKASVDNALKIMKKVGPKAREHMQGIQAELKSVQKSIDTAKGNIKEINKELSYVFKISRLLRNVISHILHSVSNIFMSGHDDLQESKTFEAQGKDVRSRQDLRNQKITLREDLANKKEVLAEFSSELREWGSLFDNFETQMADKEKELVKISKTFDSKVHRDNELNANGSQKEEKVEDLEAQIIRKTNEISKELPSTLHEAKKLNVNDTQKGEKAKESSNANDIKKKDTVEVLANIAKKSFGEDEREIKYKGNLF